MTICLGSGMMKREASARWMNSLGKWTRGCRSSSYSESAPRENKGLACRNLGIGPLAPKLQGSILFK